MERHTLPGIVADATRDVDGGYARITEPFDEPSKPYVLRYFITGFAMGSADIVPGVSGGTIAFIAGIYEKLINSIKTVSSEGVKRILKGDVSGAVRVIPFGFLLPLGLGILTAIFTLARFLEYALVEYPIFVWSFFFGLIVASVFLVKKKVKKWSGRLHLVLILSTIIAYFIVGAVPVETPATIIAFFLSGSIAITAMILPGISGSFLLLIMGKYQQILSAVTELDIITLGAFAVGAAIGLAVFSQLLSWLFKKHHDYMIAALTGLMIGSLRKVWPWKETLETYVDRHGEIIPLVQKNIPPNIESSEFLIALLLAGIGFIIIRQIERIAPERK